MAFEKKETHSSLYQLKDRKPQLKREVVSISVKQKPYLAVKAGEVSVGLKKKLCLTDGNKNHGCSPSTTTSCGMGSPVL